MIAGLTSLATLTLFVSAFLIVIFWKSRPIWAMILAVFVLYLATAIVGIYQTFQAIELYPEDKDLFVIGLKQSFTPSVVRLSGYGLVLVLAQRFARRNYKYSQSKADLFD